MVPRLTIYKQKKFSFFFCIAMFFFIHSDISQNDAEVLKRLQQEMQQRYEKKQ